VGHKNKNPEPEEQDWYQGNIWERRGKRDKETAGVHTNCAPLRRGGNKSGAVTKAAKKWKSGGYSLRAQQKSKKNTFSRGQGAERGHARDKPPGEKPQNL